MIYYAIFVLALIFWVSIWFIAGRLTVKYETWKHEQYADKHFKQTERFRREFTG